MQWLTENFELVADRLSWFLVGMIGAGVLMLCAVHC